MIRSDRRIALAALVVATLALVGIWISGRDVTDATATSGVDNSSTIARKHSTPQYYAVESRTPERFPFDPNTADSTQLLRLGLQPWQVRNIYKYRACGGIYRRKEDFARLYGLTVKQYRELEPYIRISTDYLPASILVGKQQTSQHDSLHFPVKLQETEHVVLNTADTSELKRVPGIGTYYAKEIVRHGQWLGGYVSVDQLDEIENFPQEAKKYFVIENAQPRKLNINRLTLQQLRRHPYINYYQAKAITDYRRLHGDIKSIDELRLSKDFSEDVIQRLLPYIEY